jgi:hypothetical protein
VSAHDLVRVVAITVAAVNGLVAAYGAAHWYRGQPSQAFWRGVRVGQSLALVFAVVVAALWFAKRRAAQDLFYLYAVLPLAVGLIAEQLRIASAETVLATRDLDSAEQVGELPPQEQRAIVVAILRRETGVMAAAALVVSFLALRAAGTF